MKSLIVNGAKAVLPSSIRKKIFNFGFNLAPEQFSTFSYLYGNSPNMELNLTALRDRGFQPKIIFDIGAFEGTFCKMARAIWPQAQIVMFEANEEKQPILSSIAKEEKAELRMSLLGPEDGKEVEFFVMGSGSSVLEENSPLGRTKIKKKTSRLDTLAGDLRPNFLKLDVQGFELQVLSGAEEVLATAEAVLMEVSLIEINKGAPLFAEVVGFMASRGFEVADIVSIHRRPLDQATNQVDVFFTRSDHALLSDRRHFA